MGRIEPRRRGDRYGRPRQTAAPRMPRGRCHRQDHRRRPHRPICRRCHRSLSTVNAESIETSGAEVCARQQVAPVHPRRCLPLIKRRNDFGPAESPWASLPDAAPDRDQEVTVLTAPNAASNPGPMACAEPTVRRGVHRLRRRPCDRYRRGDTAGRACAWRRTASPSSICPASSSANGRPQHQVAPVCGSPAGPTVTTLAERMTSLVTDLNVASNKGLSERFEVHHRRRDRAHALWRQDASPQARPWSPSSPWTATTTASAMAWGFNPYLMEADQSGRRPVRGRVHRQARCRRL